MKAVARDHSYPLSKIKNLPYGKIFACIAIIAFMIMMIVKPAYYLDSARRGLSLYATSVLPSLFPFYFFSLLLTYIGCARSVSTIFKKPVRVLYNAPKESAYILFLSMLSGYPVGASMTAELYNAGVITQKEAKGIAAFASTSGPIFILGTVGSAIFQNAEIGAIILAAHYLSALLNGLIYRTRKDKNNKSATDESTAKIASAMNLDEITSKTISNSTMSMLFVGGYIVICGMLVDTLSLLNADGLILAALGENAGQPIIAMLYGLIEMTRGSIACAECAFKPIGIALCAGIISFGGLSVTLQNYVFLSKCHMKLGEIFIRKATQSIIAFLVALGLSLMI